LSNLLREFLGRQLSGSIDLDHAVRHSGAGSSAAAIDTAPQRVMPHCRALSLVGPSRLSKSSDVGRASTSANSSVHFEPLSAMNLIPHWWRGAERLAADESQSISIPFALRGALENLGSDKRLLAGFMFSHASTNFVEYGPKQKSDIWTEHAALQCGVY
jgi:hypothetical protein